MTAFDSSEISDVRIFLYEAAEALDDYGDTPSAVAMRAAAELLGSPLIVRKLRPECTRWQHRGEGDWRDCQSPACRNVARQTGGIR